ncbi:hypothetical protein ACS0PU_007061 [Formica fusca]
MRFDSGTKYDSMRGELYHFSGERKRFTQFIRALLERIHILLCSLRGRFSFNNAHSLFYRLKRALFFMRTQPMAGGPIARSPLAVRRKQKSKLGRSEYTRIPRLPMEFNICCLRYETRGRAFFALFHSQSRSSSLTIHSLRSFLNAIEVSAERHDLCLKYIR